MTFSFNQISRVCGFVFFLYLASLKRSFMEVTVLELLLFFWETEKLSFAWFMHTKIASLL